MRAPSLLRRLVPLARALPALAVPGALLTLGSCTRSEAATELVLVTDTDLPLGAQGAGQEPALLSVQYVIQDAAHTHEPSVQDPIFMVGATRLPLYLGVLSADGAATEMELTVIGTLSEGKAITRVHTVRFQPGRVLEVPMHLWSRCQSVQDSCASDQTCSERGCVSREIDSPSAWDGSPSSIDVDQASAADGGADAQSGSGDGDDHAQGDAGADDDPGDDDMGDGDSDPGDGGGPGDGDAPHDAGRPGGGDGDNGREDDAGIRHPEDAGMSLPDAGHDPEDAGAPMCGGADLTSDPRNCGRCGWVCQGTHATGACVDSACECESKFGDCRADKPGCETDFTSWKTCGACNVRCEPSSQKCDAVTLRCVPK